MSSSKRRRRNRQSNPNGNPLALPGESAPESAAAEPIVSAADHTPAPEPTTPAGPQPRASSYEFERIGDILRRARERRGEDLDFISDYLRIRPGFLAALEDSRYEEFPADAYVIGFLRSYAIYLGLDGRAAIDHYRHEMAGRRRRPTLNMPQPIYEGRAPTVFILIGAAIAAILIYVLWYSLSSSDRTDVAAMPALPRQTATIVATASPADPGLLPALTATPADAAASIETTPPPAVPAVSGTVPAPATAPDSTELPDATASPAATAPEKPKAPVFGDKKNQNPRIVVQADSESWIMIADNLGNTVFDRILKPGESYIVPNIKGLTLTTGNANGLILKVDGVEIPRIVSSSRVVRAVPLDPERLKAGQQPGE